MTKEEKREYHREYQKECSRKYRLRNKEKVKETQRRWKERNPEKDKESKRKWYLRNKKYVIKYDKNRIQTDIQYKLVSNLRCRLNLALRRNYKSGSAIRDLGCSIEYFKKYIEQQFQEGMSWDNWGDWHIDHRTPLSTVDLTDRESLKQVCHYTNLQPMWAGDNYKKGNKIVR